MTDNTIPEVVMESGWYYTDAGQYVQVWRITQDGGCWCSDMKYHCASKLYTAPPNAPVGVKTLPEFMAEQEAIHPGIRGKVQAAADELRASLAQQPAAVDGPYRMVDGVVTVNGIALDEVVRLGGRYAATIEKRGMPRAAQVFEALVLIGKHALAAQLQHQEPTT